MNNQPIYKNLSLQDMDGEEWRPVPDFEGLYSVSNMGRIRSEPRTTETNNGGYCTIHAKIKTQNKSKKGYLTVLLYKDNKRYTKPVHRYVALAFIPNPDNKPQVDHINGDKEDNRAISLRWTTNDENYHNPATFGNQQRSCQTDEYRKKRSQQTKEIWKEKGDMYRSVLYSKKTRDKIFESNKQKKTVYHYDENGVFIESFRSMAEAQRITKVNNISAFCLGKHKPRNRHIWSYQKLH